LTGGCAFTGGETNSPCRSPDSWPWTDHALISLIHSPTPPKCSTRAIVALINNLGIVYHQYCSSLYLDYPADPGSSYRSRQWKSSSNLIPTRPPELQSQSRLPTDSDEYDWEGLPAVDRTWRAWKVAFRLAHLKLQRQLQAVGGGEPLRGAHSVLPAPPVSINCLGTALDNLALAAANDTTVLLQLTVANLALTNSNATLTAANKKLSEALAKLPASTPRSPGPPGTPRVPNKPFPGNYCWTHGHLISERHTSATCGNKATGHKDAATASNTMGGSDLDKGWNTRRT